MFNPDEHDLSPEEYAELFCPQCGGEMCEHGCRCDCCEGYCLTCDDAEEAEYQAKRNAEFNPILAALCGFDEEKEEK